MSRPFTPRRAASSIGAAGDESVTAVFQRVEALEKAYQEERLARMMIEGEITKERSERLKMEEHLDEERSMREGLEDELKALMKPVRKNTTDLEEGLQELAQKRTNALKAAGDNLTLSTDPKYRDYANESVRRNIRESSFGRNSMTRRKDSRLNDLFPSRKATPIKRADGSFRSKDPLKGASLNVSIKSLLLPRVRDPITGRERPVINLPLGMAPAAVRR